MVKWHLVCMWVYDIQVTTDCIRLRVGPSIAACESFVYAALLQSKREYFCDCQKWLSREHGAGSMQVEIKVKLIKG